MIGQCPDRLFYIGQAIIYFNLPVIGQYHVIFMGTIKRFTEKKYFIRPLKDNPDQEKKTKGLSTLNPTSDFAPSL